MIHMAIFVHQKVNINQFLQVNHYSEGWEAWWLGVLIVGRLDRWDARRLGDLVVWRLEGLEVWRLGNQVF